jgi:hypothetical protein
LSDAAGRAKDTGADRVANDYREPKRDSEHAQQMATRFFGVSHELDG